MRVKVFLGCTNNGEFDDLEKEMNDWFRTLPDDHPIDIKMGPFETGKNPLGQYYVMQTVIVTY